MSKVKKTAKLKSLTVEERVAQAAQAMSDGEEANDLPAPAVPVAPGQPGTPASDTESLPFGGKNPNPLQTRRNSAGFGPGNQVGKGYGRPRGSVSGRTQTLRLIDAVYAQPEIQAALAKALVETMLAGNKEALDTLRTIVMPLTPKEVLVREEGPAKPVDQKLGVRITINNTTNQPAS